jgi:tetratricopeptide (TPR) repeat protein
MCRTAEASREACLAVVSGGPGTGKTRLGSELARHTSLAGWDVVELRAENPLTGGQDEATRLVRAAIGWPDAEPVNEETATARLGERVGAEVWQGLSTFLQAAAGERRLAASRLAALRAVSESWRRRARLRSLLIVVDDAHWASEVILDALGGLAAAEERLAVAVVMVAHEDALERRAPWLKRLALVRVELGELGEADAVELARRLLAPVSDPPRMILERLAQAAARNPGQLEMLVRSLKREGIVRRIPGSELWFVAGDELESVPQAAAVQWFADRELARLPAGVRAFAQLCAVLGDDLERAGIDSVQARLDRDSTGEVLSIEASAGLAELTHRGLLARSGDRHVFRSKLVREAIEAAIPGDTREAVHRAACEHWLAEPGLMGARRLQQIAHHAPRCGRAGQAITAHLALASRAHAEHRTYDAEGHYTAALALLDEEAGSELRAQVMLRRSAARRALSLYEAALEDASAARIWAEGAGHERFAFEAMCAQALLHDFHRDYPAARRCVDDASGLASRILDPSAQARYLNVLGLGHCRAENLPEAARQVSSAVDLATVTGEYDVEVGGSLVLGYLLDRTGRHAEGLAVLDRLIALCERRGDYPTMCDALANRADLLRRACRPEDALADLDRALVFLRDLGRQWQTIYDGLLRSEALFSMGDLESALAAAARGHGAGGQRYARSEPWMQCTYALFLALAGQLESARQHCMELARADGFLAIPSRRVVVSAIELSVAEELELTAWEDVYRDAEAVLEATERIAMFWLGARTARRLGDTAIGGRFLDQARALAALNRCHPGLVARLEGEAHDKA